MDTLQIAIDGPVGSGKSDISVRLSRVLGLVYLYTGAMYRAAAYLCKTNAIDISNEEAVIAVISSHDMDIKEALPDTGHPCKVYVDGVDVTEALFTPEIDVLVSKVSAYGSVRKIMVARQKELSNGKRVVVDGRDIGLRVLPNAQLKIYLTAAVQERAQRRFQEYQKKGKSITYEEVLEDTKRRDHEDMTRDVDPLQKLPDAWELDTTGLSQEQVIAKIIDELRQRGIYDR